MGADPLAIITRVAVFLTVLAVVANMIIAVLLLDSIILLCCRVGVLQS